MATTTVIRAGYDTWVSSTEPTSKHPRDNRLRVKSGTSYAYVYLPLGPELRGNTILSAPHYLYGRGTAWGSQTVTVRRITSKWDAATLTWNDQPSVGTTAVTRTQGNPDDPTEWVIDIAPLVQEFASGSRWFGVRIEIGDTTERRFNSLDADGKKPRLEVRWTEAPAAPVDLSPSGGRAVSSSRPVLTWSNEDSPDGSTLTAFEVQIDPAANGTTPGFSLVRDPADAAELDLAQTGYAGLAAGATTQWRVRVSNDSGWGAWSDWATFTNVAAGAVTVLTPGDLVAEFTPPVAWSTTFAQKAWQILVTEVDDPTVVLHNTGRKSGALQEYTIPAKDAKSGRRILRDDRDYRLVVRAWDGVDREATPGDPGFASAVVVFHYADDPTINPVVNLSAEQVQGTPYIDLLWQRSTTPDGWVVTANGKVVEDGLSGPDLLVAGTYYKFRFRDAYPGVQYDYRIKPVVNGVTGPSPAVTMTTKAAGIWVMGPDDIDVPIAVTSDDFGSFSMPDRATTIELPQGLNPIRVTQGVNGLRGDIRGALKNGIGRTTDEWADRLLKIKKRYDEPVTLYFGDLIVRARIFDIVVEPSRDPDGRTRLVSFGFFETGTPEWLD